MNPFGTLVGQYNSVAVSLTTGENGYIALDSASRIIFSHLTASTKIGDGLNLLDVPLWGTASAGDETGLLPFGIYKATPTNLADTDGDFVPFQFDGNGRLRVDAEVSVSTGSDKEEDTAHTTGDIGAFILGIRLDDLTVDNSALLAGTNGDYQGLFTNAKGELYTKDTDVSTAILDITQEEDAGHTSGDKGVMTLAVRNDANADLTSTDLDYSPIAVDSAGRVKTIASEALNGTDADIGVDEAGDGEIPVPYHATNFVDMASIPVGAGENLYIEAFNASCDKLTEFRLVIIDDTTLTAVIRKLPVTENIGANEWTFPRVREVAGVANRTVKLQGRCLRVGQTSNCGGGINAYKI